jgi:putative SOS response-associated peptidase YedK
MTAIRSEPWRLNYFLFADYTTQIVATVGEAEGVLAPNYNVAPSTFLPVVRIDDEGDRELTLMRWGLIPFFSKDDKAAFKSTSARAETIATLPTFHEAFKRRRCIVPADCFYE